MYPYKNRSVCMGFAGGELYCHRLLKLLQKHNYEICVYVCPIEDKSFTKDRPSEWIYDDVLVKKSELEDIPDIYDIYITHLDLTTQAIKLAVKRGKHCYFIAHNNTNEVEVHKNPSVRVIYNCNNTKNNLCHYENDGFVLIPILEREKYQISSDPFTREFITLINPHPRKGGEILKMISERMPNEKFMAVGGGYYENQAVKRFPSNVTLMEQTSNMTDVYNKTKILLYPSYLETFGMCASEAMCSGIPIIANRDTDTLGLVENLGSAGAYVYNNNNIDEWINIISQLKRENIYRKISEKCIKRSYEQDISNYETDFMKWFEKPHYKLGILVIGCQKYIADTYYQLDILEELFPDAKIRAIIGGHSQCFTKSNIYYCSVGDAYENLPQKVQHGLSLECFYDCTHVMKIDDDIFIKDINSIKIQLLKPAKYNQYCAPVIGDTKQFKKINALRLSKCQSKDVDQSVPTNVKFCFGGLYILSRNSVDLLLIKDDKYNKCIMEDVAIGSILNAYDIFPSSFDCTILERPRLKLKNII
jgi:glycosyltransferase involved in cell wall biosynthesis